MIDVVTGAPHGLAHVEGIIHYLEPSAARPRSYTYDPPPGEPQTTAVWAPHLAAVYNLRPIAATLSLDVEGVTLVEQDVGGLDFYDEDELKHTYYPEAERLVAYATGAPRVVVFDHTIRRRIIGVDDRASGQPRQPVERAHNDYTETSGPQRVRDLLGAEADALLQKRFAIINVWRPIKGPLQDTPLAVCDASTAAPEDFVASDLIYRDRIGETYGVRRNRRHRWLYAPDMQPHEALLLKCYDSARDGRARFAPHTGFFDPTTPDDAPPRESIELRTLVFFDA